MLPRPLVRSRLPLAALALLSLTAAARAQRVEPEYLKTNPKVLATFREVVAKGTEYTVRIKIGTDDVALGTVVGADGWVLTKASELRGNPVLVRLRDGKELTARVHGTNEQHDLALLKIEVKGLAVVVWKDCKTAEVGDWVATPGVSDDPVAVGVVSVAARTVTVRGKPRTVRVDSGYLGIGLVEGFADGAKVSQVFPGTAATKAGLKVDDIILSVNGKAIKDGDTLIETLQGFKAGEVVKLKFKRGEETLEAEAALGKRPAELSRGDVQNNMGSKLSDRRTHFPHIMQHDSVVQAPECGGPLVHLDGKALGINIARAGRTETWTIPSETVKEIVAQLMDAKAAVKTPEQEAVEKAQADLDAAQAGLAAAQKRVDEAKAALDRAKADADKAKKKD